MKLTMYGIKDRAAWEEAGIALPGYDVEAVSARAKEAPCGCTSELEIFSVYLSAALQTDFWKKGYSTEALPV